MRLVCWIFFLVSHASGSNYFKLHYLFFIHLECPYPMTSQGSSLCNYNIIMLACEAVKLKYGANQVPAACMKYSENNEI